MRTVKQHIKNVISDLDYDFSQFTMDDFIDHIGQKNGRRIYLLETTLPSGCYGAWLTDTYCQNEYIFYDCNLPTVHQVHVQLHELSHFLLGHETVKIGDEAELIEMMQRLQQNEIPAHFEQALARAHHQPDRQQKEEEAEILANQIQAFVFKYASRTELMNAVSHNESAAQYLRSMGIIG